VGRLRRAGARLSFALCRDIVEIAHRRRLRAAAQGLFPAIVLIVPRSPHEPNYSHQDPDQPTGNKHVGAASFHQLGRMACATLGFLSSSRGGRYTELSQERFKDFWR
jgi:hypothetical protein